jgi:hypothetical protein
MSPSALCQQQAYRIIENSRNKRNPLGTKQGHFTSHPVKNLALALPIQRKKGQKEGGDFGGQPLL